MGRIAGITTTKDGATQAVASQVTYYPFGGVQSYVNGAGKMVTRSRDLDGRIASYTLGNTSQVLGYDAASRINFIADTANAANASSYSYDNLDRLTSYLGAGTNQSFTYDATGNRVNQVLSATISPASNKLTQVTGPATNNGFSYDANGSRTNDASRQYGYDARGRMVSAVTAVGTVQYKINALGQRVQKSSPADTTLYHYDSSGQLIGESSAQGVSRKDYVYLNGMAVALFQ
jgi:YD repeat-containing protein